VWESAWSWLFVSLLLLAGGVGDGVESPEKRTKKKKQSWIRGVGTLPQR
jgi:hypothetical protein